MTESLNDLPWFADTLEAVNASLAKDRFPHAVLAPCGDAWGASELARQMVGTLLDCRVEAADTLAHADYRWVAPDGAEIKVDQVRRLGEFVALKPEQASCKVAVVRDAHLLNTSAANALLKTLEEPPPLTHLLLFTDRPGRLLPTVRSRCQTLPLGLERGLAIGWLRERCSGTDAAELEARLGEHGGPVAAAEAVISGVPSVRELLNRGDLDPWLEGEVAERLGRWYRHAVSLLAAAGPETRRVLEFTDELLGVLRQVEASNSANQRLLLERLLHRWRALQSVST